MKRKLIGIIAVFALSLLVGSNAKGLDVLEVADVNLATVTVTCSAKCSGDTGGKCWTMNEEGGGCQRSPYTTNFCKC